jgi:16S rRNA (uracil1498-N3)-methyltransferase
MKHRFFIDGDIVAGTAVTLSRDEQHHAHVVRVRENEEVEVFNGRGTSFIARYAAGALQITSAAPDREARVPIHLAMAIINLDKFDIVLQKVTELGVQSIIPLVTERVEIRAERYRGKAERWKKIVFEAVKQSGRSVIPTIEEPAEFEEVARRPGSKIVFDSDAEPSATSCDGPVTLFIGPEGGWTDAELRFARQSGCGFERLGVRRLRAETAAIIATALITARNRDI